MSKLLNQLHYNSVYQFLSTKALLTGSIFETDNSDFQWLARSHFLLAIFLETVIYNM